MLLGTTPKIGFFLNRPFWCQKHRYKPKKRGYFWHKSLIVKPSPWSDPNSQFLHSDESDYFGLSNVANSLDLTTINANANLT
jgi:hypothetical protein